MDKLLRFGRAVNPSQQGFTLTELMVTLSVLAIGLVIAVPSYSLMVATQRVRNVSAELVTAVMMARSEAVKQNTTATVSTTSTWTSGWTVSAVTSTATTTIRTFGPYSGVSLTTSPSGTNTLSIGNDGRPTGGTVTFQVTPTGPGQSVSPICVTVAGTGQVSQVSGACP